MEINYQSKTLSYLHALRKDYVIYYFQSIIQFRVADYNHNESDRAEHLLNKVLYRPIQV